MLRRILSCLAASCLAATLAAAGDLAPGVHLVPGRFVAGEQPDGNTVVFDGAGALIVFDTGRHAAHTDAIISYAHTRALPVTAIFNSHWHLDHVGGNARLREACPGARVHASGAIEQAMHGFLARYREQIEQVLAKPAGDAAQATALRGELALLDAGAALYPDERITRGGTRMVAGRRLLVGFETRAVTAGDVWLFDPATRTLAAGDLVTLPAPLFDTACPARWQAALGHLAKVDFERLVPGHGAPLTRVQLRVYRTAFDHLLACSAGKAAKAACIDGWMRDAQSLIPAAGEELARNLLDYYIDGVLRDAAKKKSLCAA